MEKARIFIPFQGNAKVEMLVPKFKFLGVDRPQTLYNEQPERRFICLKRTHLSKQVQGIDQDFNVLMSLVQESWRRD